MHTCIVKYKPLKTGLSLEYTLEGEEAFGTLELGFNKCCA